MAAVALYPDEAAVQEVLAVCRHITLKVLSQPQWIQSRYELAAVRDLVHFRLQDCCKGLDVTGESNGEPLSAGLRQSDLTVATDAVVFPRTNFSNESPFYSIKKSRIGSRPKIFFTQSAPIYKNVPTVLTCELACDSAKTVCCSRSTFYFFFIPFFFHFSFFRFKLFFFLISVLAEIVFHLIRKAAKWKNVFWKVATYKLCYFVATAWCKIASFYWRAYNFVYLMQTFETCNSPWDPLICHKIYCTEEWNIMQINAGM